MVAASHNRAQAPKQFHSADVAVDDSLNLVSQEGFRAIERVQHGHKLCIGEARPIEHLRQAGFERIREDYDRALRALDRLIKSMKIVTLTNNAEFVLDGKEASDASPKDSIIIRDDD